MCQLRFGRPCLRNPERLPTGTAILATGLIPS